MGTFNNVHDSGLGGDAPLYSVRLPAQALDFVTKRFGGILIIKPIDCDVGPRLCQRKRKYSDLADT